LTLTVTGTGAMTKTYTFTTIPTASPGAGGVWFNVSDIVNDINANVANWTAALHDDTRRASALLGHGFGSTTSFSNQPVTSSSVSLDTWFDTHCDVIQFRTDDGAGIRENVLHRANLVVGIADSGYANPGVLTLLFDSHVRDVVITDCAYSQAGSSSSVLGKPGLTYSHLYVRNTISEPPTSMAAGGGNDAYCGYEQCVLGVVGWNTASGATPVFFKDCYVAYGFQGPDAFTAAPNSGNTLFNASTPTNFHLNTLVQDQTVGDFRPLTLMPSKARLNLLDALFDARSSTDKIGALAGAAPQPVYPF
jgi:hypothetical protein